MGVTGDTGLGNANPFRYRGYYYDSETGLYYLYSRYYDPEIGRFINADDVDVLTSAMTELTYKNLYAYCDNNPVVRVDTEGELWELALAWGSSTGIGITSIFSSVVAALGTITPIGWAVIGVVAVISVITVTYISHQDDGKNNSTSYAKSKPKTGIEPSGGHSKNASQSSKNNNINKGNQLVK